MAYGDLERYVRPTRGGRELDHGAAVAPRGQETECCVRGDVRRHERWTPPAADVEEAMQPARGVVPGIRGRHPGERARLGPDASDRARESLRLFERALTLIGDPVEQDRQHAETRRSVP